MEYFKRIKTKFSSYFDALSQKYPGPSISDHDSGLTEIGNDDLSDNDDIFFDALTLDTGNTPSVDTNTQKPIVDGTHGNKSVTIDTFWYPSSMLQTVIDHFQWDQFLDVFFREFIPAGTNYDLKSNTEIVINDYRVLWLPKCAMQVFAVHICHLLTSMEIKPHENIGDGRVNLVLENDRTLLIVQFKAMNNYNIAQCYAKALEGNSEANINSKSSETASSSIDISKVFVDAIDRKLMSLLRSGAKQTDLKSYMSKNVPQKRKFNLIFAFCRIKMKLSVQEYQSWSAPGVSCKAIGSPTYYDPRIMLDNRIVLPKSAQRKEQVLKRQNKLVDNDGRTPAKRCRKK